MICTDNWFRKKIISAAEKLFSTAAISAWLFTTARNKITDLFRRKKAVPFSREIFAAGIEEDENEAADFYTLLPDPAGGPETLLMREVMRDEINNALKEIPEKHRSVF